MKMKILFGLPAVALVGVVVYFGGADFLQGKIAKADNDLSIMASSTQMQVKMASAGEKSVVVGEFVFTAGKNDVKIEQISFYPALEGTKDLQFEKVVVMGGGENTVAGPVSPTKIATFTAKFSDQFVVPANTSVPVKVSADIKENAVGNTKFTFVSRGVKGKNMVTSKSLKTRIAKDLQGSVVEVQGFKAEQEKVLEVSVGKMPPERIILAGTGAGDLTPAEGTSLAQFIIKTQNQDLIINKLEFDVGDNNKSLAWLIVNKEVGAYSNKVVLQNGKAVFDNLNWKVNKNSEYQLWVNGGAKSIADGAISGEVANVKFSGMQAIGAESAELYGFQPDQKGNNFVVRQSYPVVFTFGISGPLINGQKQKIANIAFTPINDDVEIGKMVFKINKVGDFTLDNFEMVSDNAPLYQVGNKYDELNANEGVLTFMLSEVLSSGQTYTYNLVGNVENASSGDTLAVTFDFGGDAIVTDTYANIKDAFVWSDMSAEGHSGETKDWINGYIINEPMKKITFTKQF